VALGAVIGAAGHRNDAHDFNTGVSDLSCHFEYRDDEADASELNAVGLFNATLTPKALP
jgi:hypothetical protein